jgi:hypothetical protein
MPAALSRQSWPVDPSGKNAFYGNPGVGGPDPTWKAQNLVPYTVPWTGKSVLVHTKVRASLDRVLTQYWTEINHDQSIIARYGLADVETYNYRANRNNPASLSNHSYGIAVDIAPSHNPNGSHWIDGGVMLPRRLIELFKFEGWRWGGDFSSTKDPMHVEAVLDSHHDQPPVPAPASVTATPTAPVPVTLQPVTPGIIPASTGTAPAPLVALAEAAATLVARQLIQASPQGAQIAAELRAQAVIGREIADLVIALLDKVAPIAPAPAPAQSLPQPHAPPIALVLPGPLPDFLQPTPTAAPPLAHFVGKCSWFGGPNDMGVAPSEGLAIFSNYSQAPNLFLPQQPPGTTGLARRLDPSVYYIACRWDYHRTPATMLRDQSMQATVRANGREFLAHPADWGPNEKTGRVADLSHGLMTALGISTDDQVEVIYPATKGTATMSMPSTQLTQDTPVAAPIGSAMTSKVNIMALVVAIVPPLVAQAGGTVLGLNSAQILNAITVISPIIGSLIFYFRTWRTTAILPQSLPPQTRSQLGV